MGKKINPENETEPTSKDKVVIPTPKRKKNSRRNQLPDASRLRTPAPRAATRYAAGEKTLVPRVWPRPPCPHLSSHAQATPIVLQLRLHRSLLADAPGLAPGLCLHSQRELAGGARILRG